MINFNGQSSDSFGVVVQYYPNDSAPKLKYNSVSIAGRNGDLHFSEHAYENVKRLYSCYLSAESAGFASVVKGLVAWLMSADGYKRLEDSYDTNVYRIARYIGGTEIENRLNRFGVCELEFDCYPQKFLKSGDIATEGTQFTNPTLFASKPLVDVDLTPNTETVITCTHGNTSETLVVSASNTHSHITIDCDTMDCYDGTANLNNVVSGEFFQMQSGLNEFNITVTCKPRWWTL